MDKKGQVINFVQQGLMVVIYLAVGSLVLAGLVTGLTGNSADIVRNGTTMLLNASTQLGTGGTILGVLFIVTIVGGLFFVLKNAL